MLSRASSLFKRNVGNDNECNPDHNEIESASEVNIVELNISKIEQDLHNCSIKINISTFYKK